MESPQRRSPNVLLLLTFFLAVGGLFLPRPQASNSASISDSLQNIKGTKILKVGFEGYPPYTIQNPNDGKMSGYSVDLADAISSEAGWSIEWVKTTPDTKIADLKQRRFDVMVEPIFATIPRAREVAFTRPYAYFGYAVGLVKKGDHRFKTISDVNSKGTVVVVRQGYTDESFARQNLPSAELRAMKVDDVSLVFLEVISGKAAIALGDAQQVQGFVKAHPNEAEAVFTTPPPATVPAGFIVRQEDTQLTSFFDTALSSVSANGLLRALDKKYGITSNDPTSPLH